MRRRLLVLAALISGCAGPPPEAPRHETAKSESADAESSEPAEPNEPADAGPADAEPAEATLAYTEPPPQVVHRYHVFGAMKARAAKKVIITSLLTTASDAAAALEPGAEALLEFKAKGSKEWVAVADVIVKKISTKGSRVRGNERQEIELEMTAPHPAAKNKGFESPFLPRAKVRLQVDRQEPAK